MKIAIGADHRGCELLNRVADLLTQEGHEVEVFGSRDGVACDYPDAAFKVGTALTQHRFDRGILICGSGIGMSMAANKIAGVRAALVHDEIGAEMSRRHNDANVLCIPADLLGFRVIDRIVATWLRSEFEGGRHAKRVAKIAAIEQGLDPAELPADALADFASAK